ncbi:MAG: hypothetical protein K6G25_00780 [Bacteroidales bacterium]|nr:hypothetical protein [Bacteroidales bacterium]
MDVSKSLFDRFDHFVNKMKMRHAYKQSDKVFKNSMKNLPAEKKLTREQKKEIQDFYKGLIGKEIPLYSHEYFYSRTGIYSKEYIPRSLYYVELQPKACMVPYRDAYANKNMADILLPDVKHAHTILKRMNGYFYYENKPVTKEEAIKACSNLSNAIIKPVLESSGKGVQGLEVSNGRTSIEGLSIEQLFDKYGDNFQIQEKLKQHAKMNELNATSVNTLRILTYRSGMEILLIYSVVRIGRQGQVIDNQNAGGMSTIIGEDGRLGKYAFSGYTGERVEKTDSGTVLEGFEIPSYAKAIETVKRLHYELPFFNLIGWDIAIDEVGDPVLIEWNSNPGLSQSAFGPGFGKYTERIIRELWPRKNTRYNL